MMNDFPRLGFGTWARTGAAGIAAIECALATGYRHIDTAQSYDTEAEVGSALANSGLARDEVWITTKIDTSNFGPGRLAPSLERSAGRLGGAPDLTLIHWPSPRGEIALAVYLEQLAAARSRGLTREIGVSDFPIALQTEAEDIRGRGVLLTNQVELNPAFRNRTLADFCQSRGIVVTCYQPVAQGRLGADATVTAIAEAHAATPEQVALAWELAKGYAAIPTSSRPERIASNFAAARLSLSDRDIAALDALPQAPRAIDPDWGPAWDA